MTCWSRSTKRTSRLRQKVLRSRLCSRPRLCIDYGPVRANEKEKGLETKQLSLRLASSLQEEARKTAESEGISLNQLINLAVAEKISALRTQEFFRERRARANVKKARKILKRAGREAPGEGDKIF